MDLQLKQPFLADDNEREDGAALYVDAFGDGQTQSLTMMVGPISSTSVADKAEQYIRSRLDVADIERSTRNGLFSKKTMIQVRLQAMQVSHANMLAITNVQYDLILALDLSVRVQAEA